MRLRSLLFLVVLLELGTLIGLGMLAGFWVALATVFGTGLVGSSLLRSGPGRRIPGVLLMIPGLVTDVFGLVLLLPAPRRWSARLFQLWMLKRVGSAGFFQQVSVGGFPPSPGGVPPTGMPPVGFPFPPEQPEVIQAEVLDVRESPSSQARIE